MSENEDFFDTVSTAPDEQQYKQGLEMIRTVVGDEEFQEMKQFVESDSSGEELKWIVAKTWGMMYDRDFLDLKQRSLLILGSDLALGRRGPLEDHIKVALHAGLTVDQLREAFFQISFYAGVPAMVKGIKVLTEVIEQDPSLADSSQPLTSSESQDNSTLGQVDHVGWVVEDGEETAQNLAALCGIEEWTVIEFSEEMLSESLYYGEQGKVSWISMFGKTGEMLVELCEPLSSNNVFSDFLEEKGEGIHHIGNLSHEHPGEMVQTLEDRGVSVGNQIGLGDMATLYYMDTRKELGGIYLEIVDPPSHAEIPDMGEKVTFDKS